MYQDIITYISLFFSIFGAIIIVYGGLRAIISIIEVEVLKKSLNYNTIRSDFTTKIVIALEFFIAADLIRTVIQPTLDEVIILAVIVAIRTVVGYTLDKEAKDIISNQ
ncbi:MAG TPA: DUF1622 domain-containing protein [Methanobacterium sp.]|jgi:uncharacterized membrane protein